MTSKFLTLTLAVALILLVPIVAPAQSEPRGYTCHDCPYYKGEFSITNNTSVTINYLYRWGTGSTSAAQGSSEAYTFFGIGDWDRDGHLDIVTRQDATGDLFLYPGESRRGYSQAQPVKIGNGW